MVASMRASGNRTREMEQEFSTGQMGQIMRGSGKTTNRMVKASINGKIEAPTKGNLRTI